MASVPHLRLGTACGKVILGGEHAAVYGFPAFAVAIQRGARALIARVSPMACRLRVGSDDRVVAEDDESDLGRAFARVLEATRSALELQGRPALGSVMVQARSALPQGSGLGSSAALGVAVVRALDPEADQGQTLERAMAWERVFHGSPSGIDAAVAARGGCVYFEKNRTMELVSPKRSVFLSVGHSGTTASTRAMVEGVARLRDRAPHLVDEAFAEIRALVRLMRARVEAGDWAAVGEAMDYNHTLLQRLAVSTPALDEMCELARGAGALGAKLTGSGGGGCVVALAETRPVALAIVAAWKARGKEGFVTTPNGPSKDCER